jgi:hypothetical protein
LASSLSEMLTNIQETRQLADACRNYVRQYATPELEADALIKAIAFD